MLSIHHNVDNTADVYNGLNIVARLAYLPNGRVSVKILKESYDEIVDNEHKALLIVRERV